jgi:hypothetical protein
MLLVIVDAAGEQPDVNPQRLRRLSDLGVTDMAILRGDPMTAVLLEGWALDPVRSAAEATEIVTGASGGSVLLPILQAAVTRSTGPSALDPHVSTR